ncbi:MAG: tetratricopeptide repeat protein [Gammaproteobacteria bacterium]|nr:tetratricopeptide repeat protein [Gammaproteobacteria bacterium]
MNAAVEKKPAPRQDFEALTVTLSVAAVAAVASLIFSLSSWQAVPSREDGVEGYTRPAAAQGEMLPSGREGEHASSDANGEPQTKLEKQVAERFQQAVALMHAKRYDYAITALDAVLTLAPNLPEAYVNMGYAFLGLEEFGPARGAFEKALSMKLDQVNAYYGLAVAFEAKGDYEAALGAMRSYIHLSKPDDPFLAKARSALWEWEAQLGRVEGVTSAPEGGQGTSVKPPGWKDGH